LYWSSDGKSITITRWRNLPAFSNLIVPSTIMNLPVTAIGKSAFANAGMLKSIVIPLSVTSIGEFAFEDCPGLSSIAIPSCVITIGDQAFALCKNLTSITVDQANPGFESTDGVLFDKSGTMLIQMPCGRIECYSIPGTVTTLQSKAFYACDKLTDITIPSSVTAIQDNAFIGCSSLVNIHLPSSIISIGNRAFFRCLKLKELSVPNGVAVIGAEAFRGCNNLTSIHIPPSAASIGAYAFANCNKVSSIDIPAAVMEIGTGALGQCMDLMSITVDPANKNFESVGGVLFNKSGTVLTQMPCGLTGDYSISPIATTVASEAFMACQLTTISIPDTRTSISDHEFAQACRLKAISIPSSIVSIGIRAFDKCDWLRSITIPPSVTSIDSGAFYYTDLRTVDMQSKIPPTLAQGVFEGVSFLGAILRCAGAQDSSMTMPSSPRAEMIASPFLPEIDMQSRPVTI